jgi:hypothetical protein
LGNQKKYPKPSLPSLPSLEEDKIVIEENKIVKERRKGYFGTAEGDQRPSLNLP